MLCANSKVTEERQRKVVNNYSFYSSCLLVAQRVLRYHATPLKSRLPCGVPSVLASDVGDLSTEVAPEVEEVASKTATAPPRQP